MARGTGDAAEAGILFGLGSKKQGLERASCKWFSGGGALRRNWPGKQVRWAKGPCGDGVSG